MKMSMEGEANKISKAVGKITEAGIILTIISEVTLYSEADTGEGGVTTTKIIGMKIEIGMLIQM